MSITRYKVKPDSLVYTDIWHSYNALDVSKFRHHRINQSKLFENKKNHINGNENFWNQAKRHLRRFNGILKEQFHLFMKECERRFSHSDPPSELKQLTRWVKDNMGRLSGIVPNFYINIKDLSVENSILYKSVS